MLTGLILDLYSYRGRGEAQLDKHQARNAVQISRVARELSPKSAFRAASLVVFGHMQLQASASVHTLKISSTGSHTTVWSNTQNSHTRSTPEDAMQLPEWQGT